MGRASSAAKRRWNSAHYDTVAVTIPKGRKDVFKAACEKLGVSMSGVVQDAVESTIRRAGLEQDAPPEEA